MTPPPPPPGRYGRYGPKRLERERRGCSNHTTYRVIKIPLFLGAGTVLYLSLMSNSPTTVSQDEGRRKYIFTNAINTFYFRLYGVRYNMVTVN